MRRFGADILGASLWGPGLEGWSDSQAILAGREPYVPRELTLGAPMILPPNERRRAGEVVRLALNVAQGAVDAANVAPEAAALRLRQRQWRWACGGFHPRCAGTGAAGA